MENPSENKNIEYFYKKNRYIDFLRNTNAYRDIYCSKEAAVSFILTVLTSLIIGCIIYLNPSAETSDKLIDLIGLLIGSIIGLLGFVIGGLALIVGSIGKRMISIIDENGKFTMLLSIIFRFYFIGSILGVATVIHLISYLVLLFPNEFNICLVVIFLLLNGYSFFFSLISSIMLMGSCIRLMLLQYSFETKE